jgi:REP element-mobilizing transposase RayT
MLGRRPAGPTGAPLPRHPRWDAPGLVHHVWFRGLERRALFLDDADREDFVGRAAEVVPECGAAWLAWALLDNHGHAVVRSGDVPLSRMMLRIHTGYAARFNKRRERVGYLFQGRFGSRLVTSDGDLQGLVRYVHLNPLRAGVVASLEELERYRWSGHAALLGRRPPWPFESVGEVLALFADDAGRARRRLRAWMAETDDDGPGVEPAAAAGPPPAATPRDRRPPRVGHPKTGDLAALIDAVCTWFGAAPSDLRRGSRDGRSTRARAVICHVAVARWRIANHEVARALGVSSAAVSQALPRGARIAREECDLARLPVGGDA